MPIPKPKKDEKQKDFISRCMGNETMNKEYPDNEQRSAICYTSWRNKDKGTQSNIHFIKQANVSQFTIVNYEGRPHFIAPVVIMVEGIHSGSNGVPTYYSKDILQQLPYRWNGVPVPVFHPKQEYEGQEYYVSANDPEIIERQCVGRLFNVEYDENDNGLGRLKGEIYIDIERAQKIHPGLIADIRAGKQMEVSTGLMDPDIVQQSGAWNGEQYEAITKTIIPDHLAILPGLKGACSYEDGCGIRTNQQKGGENSVKNLVSRMMLGFSKQVIDQANIMDNELRQAIDTALSAAVGGEYYVWIRGVNQEEKYFIYEREQHTVDGATGEIKLFKRNFTVNEDGSVVLADDAVEVLERREYIEIKTNQQVSIDSIEINNQQTEKGGNVNMERKEQVDKIITNEHTPYTEEHRAFLMNLEECPFSKIEEMSNKLLSVNEENSTIKAESEQIKTESEQIKTDSVQIKAENEQLKTQINTNNAKPPATVQEYVNAAPTEIQEVLQSGIRLNEQRREQLIASILANGENKFDRSALQQMSTQLLENIAALAITKSNSNFYGRQGGPSGSQSVEIPTLDVANCFPDGSN